MFKLFGTSEKPLAPEEETIAEEHETLPDFDEIFRRIESPYDEALFASLLNPPLDTIDDVTAESIEDFFTQYPDMEAVAEHTGAVWIRLTKNMEKQEDRDEVANSLTRLVTILYHDYDKVAVVDESLESEDEGALSEDEAADEGSGVTAEELIERVTTPYHRSLFAQLLDEPLASAADVNRENVEAFVSKYPTLEDAREHLQEAYERICADVTNQSKSNKKRLLQDINDIAATIYQESDTAIVGGFRERLRMFAI